MAFDPDEGRVVKMEIPFWLLRLKMRGSHVDIGHDAFDLSDHEADRRGPRALRSRR